MSKAVEHQVEDDWQEVQVKNDQTWDRQDILTGRYVQQQANVGPNSSMMYTIETEDGQKVGVWGSTVLDGKFSEIQIGSIVKIVPKGEAKSKKGVKYQDFTVYVKPGSAPKKPEDGPMPDNFLQDDGSITESGLPDFN